MAGGAARGEEYAADHGTFGLATIRREHVTCGRRELTFEYPARGGIQREQAIADEQLCVLVQSLKRRRWGGSELLAWRNGSGQPHDVTAADISDYLREVSGADFTAKDWATSARPVSSASLPPRAAPRPRCCASSPGRISGGGLGSRAEPRTDSLTRAAAAGPPGKAQ